MTFLFCVALGGLAVVFQKGDADLGHVISTCTQSECL
jgi:hypothetical protein